MRGIREQIDPTDLAQLPATVDECPRIAREGGDVARDVDDPWWLAVDDAGQRFTRHAGPWWINDQCRARFAQPVPRSRQERLDALLDDDDATTEWGSIAREIG